MTAINNRTRAVLHTTASYFGLRSPYICNRCNFRNANRDILAGHCQHCTDVLVNQSRQSCEPQIPKTQVIRKFFYPTAERSEL